MTWQEEYGTIFQGVFGTPLRQLVKGDGLQVWDEEGREYLDLLGGIAVTCLGQNHPAIVQAVGEQLATLGHVSNFFTHPPALELARELRCYLPEAKVFFANSGSEANEAALKLARKARPGGGLVALEGAFHGRTMGALSVTAKEAYRAPYAPLVEPVTFVAPEDTAALEAAVDETTAAVILEPIQGEAGVIELSDSYLQAAREITERAGALLVVDEIQTGAGRTGEFFAYARSGIRPDVVTLAKGLGGGIPIGAMLATGRAADTFAAGDHGTTFGGNPVACRAALAVLTVIREESLLVQVRQVGERWREELRATRGVEEVRGRGLLIGIGVPEAPAVQQRLLEAGFITNAPNPSTLRVAPSYLITPDQCARFTAALGTAVRG